MSLRYPITALLAAVIFIVSDSYAHDPSKHVGKPVMGEIVSMEGNTIILKTEKEEVKVILNEHTKIEKHDAQAARSDLLAGSDVHIFGTKLATGELVAKEIVITSDHHR